MTTFQVAALRAGMLGHFRVVITLSRGMLLSQRDMQPFTLHHSRHSRRLKRHQHMCHKLLIFPPDLIPKSRWTGDVEETFNETPKKKGHSVHSAAVRSHVRCEEFKLTWHSLSQYYVR